MNKDKEMNILYRLGSDHGNVEEAKLFFSDYLPNQKDNYFCENVSRKIEEGEIFYFSIKNFIIAKGTFTGEIIECKEYKYGYKLSNVEIIDSQHKINNQIFKNNTSYIQSEEQINELHRLLDFSLLPEEVSEKKEDLFEGATRTITVNAYERNQEAREQCLEIHGYNCFVCDFDFEKKFGELGKNYIHVHHNKPLSEIKKEYEVDPENDLTPVCPNCHAMLHKRKPAYSVEELKVIIGNN